MEASEHAHAYFEAVGEIAAAIDGREVDAMARGLAAVRERGGRLFIIGVGGGAGHASHAVNDFRKLCLIESYAPTDNVSELTARTNDDGWDTSFTEWLAVSRLGADDALLVFSVGGGSREHNVSVNVVNAIERAHELGAAVLRRGRGAGWDPGTVGRRGRCDSSARPPEDAARGILSGRGLARARLPPGARRTPGPLGVARRRSSQAPVIGARAAFVDRDGTINELVPDPQTGHSESPLRVEDVALIPGAAGGAETAGGRRMAARGCVQSARGGEGDGRPRSAGRGAGAGARAARRRWGETGRLSDLSPPPGGGGARAFRSVRLPQARPGNVDRCGPGAGHRPEALLDDRRHRQRRPGWRRGGLPDGADRAGGQQPQAKRDRATGCGDARPAGRRRLASRRGAGKLTAMIDGLDVKIFADGADLDGILALSADKRISGFTTNPTLMWKAGLTDYEEFAKRLLEPITAHPISFEVFADDADEMRRQALKIARWGDNVYVKIPVTTTKGESMAPLVRELSEDGVKVNVTALFTTAQVELITAAVKDGAPSYISVFAGRIADAGIDPMPIMGRAVQIMLDAPGRS